jgi:3-hydroxyisobutyrate dehydrogenase-like beta-hydroxyacid dehydrogenase
MYANEDSQSLASQGFKVKAYDVYPPSLAKVVAAGAIPCTKPEDAAAGVKVLGLMVVNAYQVEELLFGAINIAERKFYMR